MTTHNLMLVARVASASSPGHAYEVKTDGTDLSCNCAGWTRQVHTPRCQAILRGLPCSCRNATEPKTERTCRHKRDVAARIQRSGGLQAVMALIRRGVTLSTSAEATMPSVPSTPSSRAQLVAEAQRVLTNGPTRVLVDGMGLGVSAQVALERYRITPALVFIRDDGWTLGTPVELQQTAARLYRDKWVGVLALVTGGRTSMAEHVVSFEAWQRNATAPVTPTGATRRRTPVPSPLPEAPPAPVPANDMSWVGGGRAIILMD